MAVILFGLVGYYLFDVLTPRSTVDRLAAIVHHEDERQASEKLSKYLDDSESSIRARACLAIGRIADRRSGELLLPMVRDSSLEVARTAAFALGLTGAKELSGPLLDSVRNRPASVVAAAVKSAGRLADSSMSAVIAGIVGCLADSAPEVREAACYALFYAGARQEAERLVSLLQVEGDRAVQYAALFTLARLGVRSATDVYARFQADADPHYRMLAVRGLARSDSPDAVRMIAVSLNDGDNRVAAQAVQSLQAAGGHQAAEYLANRLNAETDEQLIVLMLQALRALHSNLGEATAEMHLKASLSDNLVAAALAYLGEIRGDRMVAVVDSLRSTNPPARIRVACAEAYREAASGSVVPRLAMLFADEDPLVRAAAFRQLMAVDSANLDFYLKQALADKDMALVVAALDEIGSRKLTSYLPTIRPMYDRLGELDVNIRRSLIDLATQFIDTLGADSAMAELLVAGILDKEYVVRRQAADAYFEKFERDRFSAVPPAATRITERRLREALGGPAVKRRAVVVTNRGEFEFELRFDLAPLTVLSFMDLAAEGFYDGLTFHRVVPNFVIQGGDPRGDGMGGPDFFLRCEYSEAPFVRGTVGIATSGRDTGGSQFFVTHSPQPHLDGRYTVLGQVTRGIEVVDQIVVGDIIQKIIIEEGQP